MELETDLYGFQDKPTSASPMAVSIDSRNRLSARYIRIESRIDLEFVELEAYNANKTNVALKKPVRVSAPIWGKAHLETTEILRMEAIVPSYRCETRE